jgi:hypothetical protein
MAEKDLTAEEWVENCTTLLMSLKEGPGEEMKL